MLTLRRYTRRNKLRKLRCYKLSENSHAAYQLPQVNFLRKSLIPSPIEISKFSYGFSDFTFHELLAMPKFALPTWDQAKSKLPSWETTKTTSKVGFDKAWAAVDKLGAPVNKLSNKIGSEAFWPTTLDKESDKAARILRSFVKDGFYAADGKDVEGSPRDPDSPRGKQRVVKKIPTDVIKKAKGLAIFTTMRTGLWISGAGGSGILVARTASGEWSPPSGILLHTAGLGFLVGVDIYDCVIVINSEKALQAFTKLRCTLGGEVSAVAGPVGVGGILETEIHKRQAPVWTYLKSRGFYAGVQVDGTVVIERTDENERFYNERIGAQDILAGKVRHPPYELKTLMNTIKMAQGDRVDEKDLPTSEPTPGDLEIEQPVDPDPFGVLALEKEGLEIKEAGTQRRLHSDSIEFQAPPSPMINHSHQRSEHSITSPTVNSAPRIPPSLPPRIPKVNSPNQVEGHENDHESSDPYPSHEVSKLSMTNPSIHDSPYSEEQHLEEQHLEEQHSENDHALNNLSLQDREHSATNPVLESSTHVDAKPPMMDSTTDSTIHQGDDESETSHEFHESSQHPTA